MKIIIEEYQYPVEVVKDILWEGAFQTVDGMVSINYVGYYFNSRKEVNDCVFILPKVLLDEGPDGKDLGPCVKSCRSLSRPSTLFTRN